jgi:hypothetical protein
MDVNYFGKFKDQSLSFKDIMDCTDDFQRNDIAVKLLVFTDISFYEFISPLFMP